MSERKIVVPEGMLEAVEARRITYYGPASEWAHQFAKDILDAALRWLSDNPIVPSLEDVYSISSGNPVGRFQTDDEYALYVAAQWQCRMFLAPESADAIKAQEAPVSPTEEEKVAFACRGARRRAFDEILALFGSEEIENGIGVDAVRAAVRVCLMVDREGKSAEVLCRKP